MFQGDENKFVIVSLVRSNDRDKIGFLKDINRRCVAQSRAKCGMYFLGDTSTLSCPGSPWSALINEMGNLGCVSNKLPLSCKKHKQVFEVEDAFALENVMKNYRKICKYECGEIFPCEKHKCKQNCLPEHLHKKCVVEVGFKFESCGHLGKKLCYEDPENKSCLSKCDKIMHCSLHKCKKVCSSNHDHMKCEEIVDFNYPSCKHPDKKKCF